MQDVFFLDFFRPFAFEIKGLLCGQDAGAGHHLSFRVPFDVIKSTPRGVGVVLRTVAVDHFIAIVVPIYNIAVRLERLRILVVLRVVGPEGGVEEFHHHMPVQMVNTTLGILGIGIDDIFAAHRRIDARNLNGEVGALNRRAVRMEEVSVV